MRKADFVYLRNIFSVIFLTVLSFIYLEQRMFLIKQNYHQAMLKKCFKKELLKKEELVYKIAHLEAPVLLQNKFLAFNPGFDFAKSARVVKIPYANPAKSEEKVSYSGKVSFAVEIP
ncbi:MAG: hypothetical protein P9M06_07825 [Candidatus Saelkia tenebricola]|nr:hypothetical protein [Candidatus Saelkia tenebricola]